MGRSAFAVLAVIVAISMLMVGGPCSAAKPVGAYVDDVQFLNNGQQVFFDNFNDGNLDGWTKMYDVTCTQNNCERTLFNMSLNKQHFAASTAYYSLMLANTEFLDMQAKVYVTPANEQYDCRQKGLPAVLHFTLYSGNTNATIRAALYTDHTLNGCKAGLTLSGTGSGKLTSRVVVKPLVYTRLLMRMSPRTGVATLYVDGRPVQSIRYDPRQFQTIRELGLCCSFGDGSLRTD